MRTEGWVFSPNKYWRSHLVGYVLSQFRGAFERLDLVDVIRAVKFGLPLSIQNFFNIMECYNSKTCTFFTPVGKMGMTIHKMHEVIGLPHVDFPYEELILNKWELRELKQCAPMIFEVY